MAQFNMVVLATVLICVVLVDFTAHARHCRPECNEGERCVAAGARERRSGHHNMCVAIRCLQHSRPGRCRRSRHTFHFNRALMACVADSSGSCYGRRNRFTTREHCELACLH